MITSAQITDAVTAAVGQSVIDAAPYSVSGAAVATQANAYTNVASITVTSSDPQQAAAIANAYAQVFIDWRKSQQTAQIKQAEKVISNELKGTTPGSSDYIILTQRLRDLQIRQSTVTGDFLLINKAETPTAPFAPRPIRSAVLGFGVGLFAGIGLAFLLEQLNTRLRDYRETAEILNMPVIGRIPVVSKSIAHNHDLAVVESPEGRVSEAFRMLRGNLEFVAIDGETGSLLITSCKQGEGKSMTIANLAATLALAGKNIILVDGDLRRPQAHLYFDLKNDVGLSTLLAGKQATADVLQNVRLTPNVSGNGGGAAPAADTATMPGTLRVLTAGPTPPNPGELIASKRFSRLLDELEKRADLVLVDSPAIMAVGDAGALANAVDGLLLLVDINTARRPTLREVREVLEPMPCKKLGIIVSREKFTGSNSYKYGYYRYQRA